MDMERLVSKKYWTRETPYHFEFRNPQPAFPLHSHDFTEIVIIYNGTGLHRTPQQSFKLEAGDVVFIKPGQIHGYDAVDNLVLMNILIKPSFLADNVFGLSTAPGYSDLFLSTDSIKSEPQSVIHFRLNRLQLFEVQAILESMQEEIDSRHLLWNIENTIYLFELFILLLRIYNNPAYPATTEKDASAVVKYVEKNFRENFTIKQLMECFNMSESTVLRTFKRITGYSASEYQMRRRMLAATDELTSTDKSVTQIAYDMGFNDSNYFSRSFRRFTGITPTAYRKRFAKK